MDAAKREEEKKRSSIQTQTGDGEGWFEMKKKGEVWIKKKWKWMEKRGF